MRKYPDLEMIAGMNEYSAVGAARAVKAAGAKIGSGSWCGQLTGGRPAYGKRSFKGIVVQKAFKMGYMGVRNCSMLRGEAIRRICEFRMRAGYTGQYV